MSSGSHSDIGPELRQLAQAILDRLDPAVRSAAAMAADDEEPPPSVLSSSAVMNAGVSVACSPFRCRYSRHA